MSDHSMAKPGRQWRVSVVLVVPRLVLAGADSELPVRLEFVSRVHDQARQYGDVPVAIRPADAAMAAAMYGVEPSGPLEAVELVLDIAADDEPSTVIATAEPLVNTIVDQLSFQLATQIGVGQVRVVDITPPAKVGDRRRFQAYGGGSPFERNATVEMQAVQGAQIAELPASVDIDRKTAAVLRWYVKAGNTNLLHDQFIFLWIALEILCDASDVKVEEPYKCRHRHPIPHCPECGVSTTIPVRGATLREFLERHGVPAGVARHMWNARQMMHGARREKPDAPSLAELVQPLRAVVALGVKERLGLPPEAPPVVQPSGLSIHPAMAAGGETTLREVDADPLTPPPLEE